MDMQANLLIWYGFILARLFLYGKLMPCKFLGEIDNRYGTGFLVNIPESEKYCIVTAGHNLRDPKGRATNVNVKFPGGLEFIANPDEFFVSKIYDNNPTMESEASDYGLIAVDRKKYPSDLDGGCAFSILPTDSELLLRDVTVHGYRGKEPRQSKATSEFDHVSRDRLYYKQKTEPGVSGGAVFIINDGGSVVVGIQ
jgi:V8-like Glu-specific endopeptidase